MAELFGFSFPVLALTQLLATALLAAVFLQSGLDKILDREGNKAYIGGQFANTPLAPHAGWMLLVVTVLETSAGVLLGLGALLVLLGVGTSVAFLGVAIAGANVVGLMFGQRVVKDYGGAAVLVPYFLLILATMLLLKPAALGLG